MDFPSESDKINAIENGVPLIITHSASYMSSRLVMREAIRGLYIYYVRIIKTTIINMIFGYLLMNGASIASEYGTQETSSVATNIRERIMLIDAAGDHWDKTEKELDGWLHEHPEDNEARFLLARILSWQKKYNKSINEYQLLIAKEPNNADYLLGIANTYHWSGDNEQAISALRKATKLSPKYSEAWIQLARVLHRNHEDQEAEKTLKEAQQWVSPKALASLRNEIQKDNLPRDFVLAEEPAGKMNHVELGGGYEHLNNGYKDWSSSWFDGSHQFESGEKIYTRLSDLNRFGLTDATLMGGFTKTFGKNWTTTIESNESPTGHFSPQWSMLGSVHYQLDIPIGFDVSYKYSSYRTLYNSIGTLGIEGYTGNWRIAGTVYFSGLEGAAPTYSGLADIAYYYDDKSFVGTLLGYGKQVIAKAPGVYENSESQTYVIRGQHFITPDWAITYDGGTNILSSAYTRTGFNIGLRYIF